MTNVPLSGELIKHAPAFMERLTRETSFDMLAKDLTSVDDGAAMFAAADTRVFVRARPLLRPRETDPATVVRRVAGKRETIFMAPKVSLAGKTDIIPTPMTVDATFTDTDSSDDMYRAMGQDLVKLALGGGSSSILCYGQTGSGKTYTTMGLLRCATADIISALTTCDVEVTFVEVRTEGCRDLVTGSTDVDVMEDILNSVQIKGGLKTKVTSAPEFEELVERAFAARSTKATGRNDTSSRSHMAIRFIITQKDAQWAQPGVLCVVDLAGSESSGDAKEHDKARINETKFINSSLMTLKECIRARGTAATSTKHIPIPYRRSKLTLLLRDSFELVVRRPTKTAIIACVSPLLHDSRHTYNTLRYVAMLYLAPCKSAAIVENSNDPTTWARDKALKFLLDQGVKAPEHVLPEGDGRTLSQVPEGTFVKLCVETKMCDAAAQLVYSKFWKAIVDGRTKHRKVAKSAREHLLDAVARNKENATRAKQEDPVAAAEKPTPAAVAPKPAAARAKFVQPEMVFDAPAPSAAPVRAPAPQKAEVIGGRLVQPEMVWD
jgi:hypothetical protein